MRQVQGVQIKWHEAYFLYVECYLMLYNEEIEHFTQLSDVD